MKFVYVALLVLVVASAVLAQDIYRPPPPGCVCYDLWQPVCGTDGKVHSNDCDACCGRVEYCSTKLDQDKVRVGDPCVCEKPLIECKPPAK